MILYYTHNYCDENIFKACQKQLLKTGLPIVSVSLKPIDFGENIVIDKEPGAITMVEQIVAGLEAIQDENVFFCEHDVLYHLSHFDFKPPREDTFYFNINNWRWDYPKDRLIAYDGLKSLSGMCANRNLALKHYKDKLNYIEKRKYDNGRDPSWARKIGYEPGKTKRRGGWSSDLTEEWVSKFPNIDIRHDKTMTKPKVSLASFKHQPTGWREIKLNQLIGWNFKELWN
jgi:hypothetical protein